MAMWREARTTNNSNLYLHYIGLQLGLKGNFMVHEQVENPASRDIHLYIYIYIYVLAPPPTWDTDFTTSLETKMLMGMSACTQNQ